MKIQMQALLLLLISVYGLSMDRPLRPRKQVITTTRGLKRKTATDQLQELVNDWSKGVLSGTPWRFKLLENYIDLGANPNIVTKSGMTLLELVMWALYRQNFPVKFQEKIIKKLLDSGADVNAISRGQSLLYWASYLDMPYVVKLLLEYGADLDLDSNRQAIHWVRARPNRYSEINRIIDSFTEKAKTP